MNITRRQLRRLIIEEVKLVLAEKKRGKGCADTPKGCTRRSSDGTWYILNNKKGGMWRKGFKTKKKALAQLRVPGIHKG